ncbi:MAG: pyroglutamyl-peptidase I [Tissierellales bacterium]
MKILVTAFDPFGGETVNPAYEAVKMLEDKIKGADIVKLEIPTVFGKSIEKLEEALEKERPDAVICVGQAGGRSEITVERIAINIVDARIKDNEGNMPEDEAVYQDGPAAYFSNLPIKQMVKSIRENGIPASVSNTAGTFVCNHIMYSLLFLNERKNLNIKGGFIHVPYIPKQTVDKRNTPSMSIEDIIKGITYAIEALIRSLE